MCMCGEREAEFAGSGKTGSAGFYWEKTRPLENAWQQRVSPQPGEIGVGGRQAPSVFKVSIHPGVGDTVPKEMVSSPLNPLLRFRKRQANRRGKRRSVPGIPYWADCLYFS